MLLTLGLDTPEKIAAAEEKQKTRYEADLKKSNV